MSRHHCYCRNKPLTSDASISRYRIPMWKFGGACFLGFSAPLHIGQEMDKITRKSMQKGRAHIGIHTDSSSFGQQGMEGKKKKEKERKKEREKPQIQPMTAIFFEADK